MKQTVIRFGMLAAALMLLLQVSKYSLVTRDHTNEVLIAIIASFFIAFGLLIGHVLRRQKVASKVTLKDEQKAKKLDLSKRECEVLLEMARGRSNKEIAEALFITESTVKTHVSNLLVKLEAKRRTEAINNARNWGLL